MRTGAILLLLLGNICDMINTNNKSEGTMDFGSVIKKRRQELGLTLEEIAKTVGVNRATVLRWERGEIKNARSDKIVRLADRLGISPDALLDGDALSTGYSPAATIMLPVITGFSCEGSGKITLTPGEEFRQIPYSQLDGEPKDFFLWRVDGDAMYPRFIAGDVLLLRRADAITDGRTMLLLTGGVPLLRNITGDGSSFTLVPVNPEYSVKPALSDTVPVGIVRALFRDIN